MKEKSIFDEINKTLVDETNLTTPQHKKTLLIDHATKKTLVESEKERVRQDLELILSNLYQYPFNRMDIDVPISFPKKNNLFSNVDLVIYDESNNMNVLFKIIDSNDETKTIKEDFSLFFRNYKSIKYCCLFDGNTIRAFSFNNILIELADLPPYPYLTGKFENFKKSDLIPADKHLKQNFKAIHNYLYANSNIRIASRIGEELVKIILCKIEDEKSENEYCKFFSPLKNEDLSQTKGNLIFLWNKVKERLPSYSEEELNLDDKSLSYVVKKLQKFNFMGTNSDILGESFQIFIDQSRLQDLGAFFTEIQAVKLAIEILDISIEKKESFIDPFQGTGGFIQAFVEKIQGYYKSDLNNDNINNYSRKYVAGIDIEEELIKISEAKMITIGDIKYGSYNENSLENPDNWSLDTKKNVVLGTFDKIGTNPPFGTKITIQSQDILEQYELSRKWSRTYKDGRYVWTKSPSHHKRNPRVPDILGLERVLQLLATPKYDDEGNLIKKGGKAAVVLPRQIFSGPKEMYVREWIMRNTIVHAIIDLPTETFQPHTGTKTSIIVFSKRAFEKEDWYNENDHEIFMSIPSKIGHDRRGLPEYKRDKNGTLLEDEKTGDYIIDSDINNTLNSWKAFNRGKKPQDEYDNSFIVKVSDLDKEDLRLDASYYNPESSTIVEHINQIPELTEGKWTVKPLGDLVKDVFVPGRFKRNYVSKENGTPFLSGTNISQFMPVGVKYLSKNSKNLDQYLIEEGWILITRSGTTGIVSMAPNDWRGLAVSDHVIRILPDDSLINSGYLYIYLKSKIGQAIMKRGIYGSVVDEITPEFIKSIPVAYPKNLEASNEIGDMIKNAIELRAKSTKLIYEAENQINELFEQL